MKHAITAWLALVPLAGATAQVAGRPVVEPSVSHASDSDGLHTTRAALQFEWPLSRRVRATVGAGTGRTGDGESDRSHQDAWGRIAVRPDAATRITARAGLLRADAIDEWTTAVGEIRARWKHPESRLAFDARAQRAAVIASPGLIDNHAVRSELSGMASVPVGPVILRAGGRTGRIVTTLDDNSRLAGDAMLALPVGAMELSAQYHRLGYAHDTSAGYFAPALVETVEGGLSAEVESEQVVVSFDGGIGAQRLREFGGTLGPWRLALRGWGAVTVPLSERIGLQLEAEAYDAPFAVGGVPTTDHWRYLSLAAGARLTL